MGGLLLDCNKNIRLFYLYFGHYETGVGMVLASLKIQLMIKYFAIKTYLIKTMKIYILYKYVYRKSTI